MSWKPTLPRQLDRPAGAAATGLVGLDDVMRKLAHLRCKFAKVVDTVVESQVVADDPAQSRSRYLHRRGPRMLIGVCESGTRHIVMRSSRIAWSVLLAGGRRSASQP